ncbi:MAG: RusA family crossover junction endodeoxyribonuclease [Pyrinomonadaceae bacterium]
MTTTRINFTVLGDAKPAGSKRAFALKRRDGSPVLRPNGTQVVTVVDANPNSKPWKQEVARAAREAYCGDLLDGPLRLHLKFFRPRPKGHFTTTGLSKAGRESIAPTTKPDVLKLARAVEDSLTGVIWRDDSQVVVELLTKEWGEPARVEVVVENYAPRVPVA